MDESFTDLSPCTFRLSKNTHRSRMYNRQTRSGTNRKRVINDHYQWVANIMFRGWCSDIHMGEQCQY